MKYRNEVLTYGPERPIKINSMLAADDCTRPRYDVTPAPGTLQLNYELSVLLRPECPVWFVQPGQESRVQTSSQLCSYEEEKQCSNASIEVSKLTSSIVLLRIMLQSHSGRSYDIQNCSIFCNSTEIWRRHCTKPGTTTVVGKALRFDRCGFLLQPHFLIPCWLIFGGQKTIIFWRDSWQSESSIVCHMSHLHRYIVIQCVGR